MQELRDRVRGFVDTAVLPVINDYWERAEFPHELVPKPADLGVAGYAATGPGCPELGPLETGIVIREPARGDGSVTTFTGVQSGPATGTIALLGNASFADVVVVWTRDTGDGNVGAFVVEKAPERGHPHGYSDELITGKIGKRAVWRSAGAGGAAWGSLGHAMAAFEIALDHTDMEVVDTYEGTDHIQSLIVGRDLAGTAAFT